MAAADSWHHMSSQARSRCTDVCTALSRAHESLLPLLLLVVERSSILLTHLQALLAVVIALPVHLPDLLNQLGRRRDVHVKLAHLVPMFAPPMVSCPALRPDAQLLPAGQAGEHSPRGRALLKHQPHIHPARQDAVPSQLSRTQRSAGSSGVRPSWRSEGGLMTALLTYTHRPFG